VRELRRAGVEGSTPRPRPKTVTLKVAEAVIVGRSKNAGVGKSRCRAFSSRDGAFGTAHATTATCLAC